MSFKKYYTGGNKEDNINYKTVLSKIREDLHGNDIIYLYDCDTETYDYVISIKEGQEDSFYSTTRTEYFKPISKIYTSTNSASVLNNDRTILDSYKTGFNYVLPIDPSASLDDLKNINIENPPSISTIITCAKYNNNGKGIEISLDKFQYGDSNNKSKIGNHIFKNQNSHIDEKYSYWHV